MDIANGVVAEAQLDVPAAFERSRIARVDYERLHAIREELVSGRTARLQLNLFHDVEFAATIERSAPTASGYSLSGPLDGVPFGRVVLVVNGKHTVGRVYTPEGVYAIRTTGAMQTVERVEPEPLRCEAVTPPDDEGLLPHSIRPDDGVGSLASKRGTTPAAKQSGSADRPGRLLSGKAAADDGDVVDVLVVYPSFVRQIEGGYEQMLAHIDLDLATANEAYAASGVELRIELAAAVEVEYDRFLDSQSVAISDFLEPEVRLWRGALEHLTHGDDGYLDEVHALRDRHAADLVLLHLGGDAHQLFGDYFVGGIAWAPTGVSDDLVENRGFSVARSGDGTVVAHELGHSMGLRHDRYEDNANEPFPYSHRTVQRKMRVKRWVDSNAK